MLNFNILCIYSLSNKNFILFQCSLECIKNVFKHDYLIKSGQTPASLVLFCLNGSHTETTTSGCFHTQKAGCHVNKTGSKQSFFSSHQEDSTCLRILFQIGFPTSPSAKTKRRLTVFRLSVPATSVHFKISSLKSNMLKNLQFLLAQRTDFLMTAGLSRKNQTLRENSAQACSLVVTSSLLDG
jgi:hypothetical protein